MLRTFFMHLSNKLSEKVSKSPLSRIRTLMMAIALSVSSCISPQNNQWNTPSFKTVEVTECDIDNPVFIALVSIGAEVQAGIECPENRSLRFVWETCSSRLQEMNLKHDVSVSLCAPQATWRWFAYILIDVAWQQIQIFAKDQKTAEKRTKEIQESCITYIVDRMHLLLGENPATKEKLQMILEDEEAVLAKHRMIAIVNQDNSKTWTISFEAGA